MNKFDIENSMVQGKQYDDEPSPERDEDSEYESIRQQSIDDLNDALRDIGAIRRIDMLADQAN